MLERFGLAHLVFIAIILVVEWWLPRQTIIKANSILELCTNFTLAISLSILALAIIIINWRKK